jgi:peptidoglycan hydrolase-like protein with peptidoglycan-binding domain
MNLQEIKDIQLLLEVSQSGIMDSDTKSCVKKFQKFANLESDGIVGPKTKSKLIDLKDKKITGWTGCKKYKFKHQQM